MKTPLNKMLTPAKESAIESAESLVNKALAEAISKRDQLTDEISAQEAKQAEAVRIRKTATDPDEIREALIDEIAAENTTKELKARLKKLQAEPYITQLEYENAVNAIYEDVNAADLHTQKELVRLAEEMAEAAHALEAIVARANNALHRLQAEAYKYKDDQPVLDNAGRQMYNVNGQPSYTRTEKRIDRGRVISWGLRGVNYLPYTQAKQAGL